MLSGVWAVGAVAVSLRLAALPVLVEQPPEQRQFLVLVRAVERDDSGPALVGLHPEAIPHPVVKVRQELVIPGRLVLLAGEGEAREECVQGVDRLSTEHQPRVLPDGRQDVKNGAHEDHLSVACWKRIDRTVFAGTADRKTSQ